MAGNLLTNPIMTGCINHSNTKRYNYKITKVEKV